jgi:hypothetical protein
LYGSFPHIFEPQFGYDCHCASYPIVSLKTVFVILSDLGDHIITFSPIIILLKVAAPKGRIFFVSDILLIQRKKKQFDVFKMYMDLFWRVDH